jgi:hypothetical protein
VPNVSASVERGRLYMVVVTYPEPKPLWGDAEKRMLVAKNVLVDGRVLWRDPVTGAEFSLALDEFKAEAF